MAPNTDDRRPTTDDQLTGIWNLSDTSKPTDRSDSSESHHQPPTTDQPDATANLAALLTEQRNPATTHVDTAGSLEIVRLMNQEDARIAAAISERLPTIARLVDHVVDAFRKEGRLFYVGAGTSGRLGTLDAVECPPTFGADPEMVQCLMAGGPSAWVRAKEGAEDDEDAGRQAIRDAEVTGNDVVVGIAASGRTPFVKGAVQAARELGCMTGLVTNQSPSLIGPLVDVAIEVPVGPEVLTGSTRLKAGTAQKMVLNMLTTAAMIRTGKAYGNLMVDVRATNEKLRDRARRIVEEGAGVDKATAAQTLDAAGGSAKTAILMARLGCDRDHAEQLLNQHGGVLRMALGEAKGT